MMIMIVSNPGCHKKEKKNKNVEEEKVKKKTERAKVPSASYYTN
jgi:hypothetical protein